MMSSTQASRETAGGPGKVVIQSQTPPPPNLQVMAYPPKRVSFGITVRPLRHFEEFLRIRPLQSEAPRSTRPWGNLRPLLPPLLRAWFCIDKTTLENYGLPQRLEVEFYSGDLVSYLVETLQDPLSQIKYKITTKRTLKPDTFKEYNFSEKEAKMMANSFIGKLGPKYNRINHGSTWTDYETAMSCQTSTVASEKNVLINHYNSVYLIREQKCGRIFGYNTSVKRFVMAETILQCLKLTEVCYGEESTLYDFNTDEVLISNPVCWLMGPKKESIKRIL